MLTINMGGWPFWWSTMKLLRRSWKMVLRSLSYLNIWLDSFFSFLFCFFPSFFLVDVLPLAISFFLVFSLIFSSMQCSNHKHPFRMWHKKGETNHLKITFWFSFLFLLNLQISEFITNLVWEMKSKPENQRSWGTWWLTSTIWGHWLSASIQKS